MSPLDAILFYLPSVAFRRRAVPVLRQELGDAAGDRIWRQARSLRAQLRAARPRHSLGVNFLIRYMELDVALYRSMLAAGVLPPRAGELIQRINWLIFGPVTALASAMVRLRSGRALVRGRWLIDAMFSVLFTAPFERTKHPVTDHIAFDVTSCPLAGYFRSQGVPELTRFAACSLDHEMAKLWGLELRRTQTIADGAPLCDFRFHDIPRGAHE